MHLELLEMHFLVYVEKYAQHERKIKNRNYRYDDIWKGEYV